MLDTSITKKMTVKLIYILYFFIISKQLRIIGMLHYFLVLIMIGKRLILISDNVMISACLICQLG